MKYNLKIAQQDQESIFYLTNIVSFQINNLTSSDSPVIPNIYEIVFYPGVGSLFTNDSRLL